MKPDVVENADIQSLLPTVYDQLRALAQRRLAEAPGEQTLQATGLVHEVYLRLAADPGLRWNDEQHLLASAAQAIRWILVDRARRRAAARHGAGERPVPLDAAKELGVPQDHDLLALHASLERLARTDRRKHDVVMLRYFGGLSIEETAQALQVSTATVKREWNFSRAWLLVDLEGAATEEVDDEPAT